MEKLDQRWMVGSKTARYCIALGALFGGFVLSGQGGADLGPGVETIENLNWSAFSALRSAQTISGNRSKSVSVMTPVRTAILKDGGIDETERLLLEKLSASTGGPEVLEVTSISPTGTPVSVRFSNRLSAEARDLLGDVLAWHAPVQLRLAQLWEQTAFGRSDPTIFREFLADSERSTLLSAFLQSEAADAWKPSAMRERNFSDFITRVFGTIQRGQPQLSAEEKRAALTLFHGAVQQFVSGLPEGVPRPPAAVCSWIANAEPYVEASGEGDPHDATEW